MKQRGLQPIPDQRKFLTSMRHTFKAPDSEQFKRATYLEQTFHTYAESIGCEFFQDEIIMSEMQARLIQSWWAEHRL